MFLAAYDNGWKGLMPWTSNGVDSNGNLNDFKSGLLAFQLAHPGLVDPSLATGMNHNLKQNQSGHLLEKVYPNPIENGQIEISLYDCIDVILQITNERGLVLFRQKADKEEICIQTGSFSKGIYLLSILKNGRVENCKLVF
jgi:hypothetical protein